MTNRYYACMAKTTNFSMLRTKIKKIPLWVKVLLLQWIFDGGIFAFLDGLEQWLPRLIDIVR